MKTMQNLWTYRALGILAALMVLWATGCEVDNPFSDDSKDGEQYCDLSIDIQHMVGCKYAVNITMYCSKDVDYIEYTWDTFMWRELPFNGAAIECEFPGPGIYQLTVRAYYHGDILAEKAKTIEIDCGY